ncbi:hypothetical protein O6H91_07G108200 [Diphasiastrum complanatum]|uniref:Uncharacterized protein n=1 Tax=Diphasiastrum complanatum TaxID=34168 RepID=A0ACC2D8N9_DIPCM|nr:hypothetical protein O6H91_07G108200 [Diphasiastrum complanatum]
MHLKMFSNVQFILSPTPFCCGLCGQVNCLLIPSCLQNSSNSLLTYSPPLSILRAKGACPFYDLHAVTYSLKIDEASDLSFTDLNNSITRIIINNRYKVFC